MIAKFKRIPDGVDGRDIDQLASSTERQCSTTPCCGSFDSLLRQSVLSEA